MATQNERLLDHLKAGGVVTNLDAWMELGIYALSQRIGELRRAGNNIESKMITVISPRFGTKARVKQYWLEGAP
jgi:hypothetical protein